MITPLSLLSLLPLLPLVASGPPSDVAATIIAMERAALDRSDKLDPDGFLEISDPGVVYIDPSLEQPIVGLENLRKYYRSFGEGGEPTSGEMLNSRVQVTGDAAVLTFNYRRKDGKEPRWNATEVYHKTERGWRIVHTHWSYIKPQPPK
ncbi:MAG TPA: nuclear transport factor 2 family protein [Vicinamibacterales bacterium]|nr:nuclear transport factor 2 family protein [Vicinamibacterales bacterium]